MWIYGPKIYQRGPPARHKPSGRPPGRALMCGGALAGLPTPIFSYMVCFTLEKSEAIFRDKAPPSRGGKLGRGPFALRQLDSAREIPLREGEDRSHRHHQRFLLRGRTNLHQHLHQHHLISNPCSSLVFNLCIKTSDWYLWVTSSVDYIL